MKTRFVVLTFVILAGLAAHATTQGSTLGPWRSGVIFYVSPTGANTNPGTKQLPWRTITYALSVVNPILNAGINVTLNLRRGTFGPGETYPLRIPAYALALEAYETGVIINGQFTSGPVIEVDRVGNTRGQATLIHGVAITAGSTGVRLAPTGATPTLTQVELRRCDVFGNGVGVDILVNSGWRAEHVIEDNDIHDQFVGIQINCYGESSTLIRSNRIWEHEFNIMVNGVTPRVCRPRIVSNFIWAAEFQISATNCSPWVVNNTIADARPSSPPVPAWGIVYAAPATEVITIVNNILWNPGWPELTLNGPAVVAYNDIEDANSPFIGINGNRRVVPAFTNGYHLQPLPANPLLIDQGTLNYVLPPLSLQVGSAPVQADLGTDVDLDPRVLDFDKNQTAIVDIGGDEVRETRLTGTAGIDPLGNMVAGAGGTTTGTVTVTGRPGDAAFLFLAHTWPQSPVYQNIFFPPFGNYLISANPNDMFTLASGVLNGAGTWSAGLVIPPLNPTPWEPEFYIQGITIRPDQVTGDMTNRLRLEINE